MKRITCESSKRPRNLRFTAACTRGLSPCLPSRKTSVGSRPTTIATAEGKMPAPPRGITALQKPKLRAAGAYRTPSHHRQEHIPRSTTSRATALEATTRAPVPKPRSTLIARNLLTYAQSVRCPQDLSASRVSTELASTSWELHMP